VAGSSAWVTATGFETAGAAAAAVGTLNDVSTSEVLTQVNAALNAAIPGSPTTDSINERIKALDDLLQASGAGDAAAIKTAAAKVAALVETAGGHDRYLATALETAPAGSGLTDQQTRDAMLLAPTPGTPAAGSIDAHLDAAALETSITAIKGAGWVDENLVEIQAAAEAASGAVGTGAKAVTVQVNDGSGNAVPNVKVTLKNAGQTADIGIQTTGATGATPSGFGLDPSTGYKVVLSGLTASYSYANPYTVTTSAGATAQTVTLVVTAAAAPEPTPDGYCKVWCLAGTEGPDATTGTFYVSEVFSPEVYDPDGTPVEIVRGGTSMALVDGAAYRQVRQEAVVTFVLATPGKQKEWTRVVIPETAEEYVQNLLAEE
jgi:hypothetical protein